MCLALIAAVQRAGIEVREERIAAALLKVDNRAAGAIFFHRRTGEFETVLGGEHRLRVGGPGAL